VLEIDLCLDHRDLSAAGALRLGTTHLEIQTILRLFLI
jgi:hypothetical protein